MVSRPGWLYTRRSNPVRLLTHEKKILSAAFNFYNKEDKHEMDVFVNDTHTYTHTGYILDNYSAKSYKDIALMVY